MSKTSIDTGESAETRSATLYDVISSANNLLRAEESVPAVYVEQLQDLAARLLEGRFHPAILGQFKRGKSSFINALLGEPVLPVGIVPLTALPTFIRSGPTREATIRFEDDDRAPETLAGATAREISDFLNRYVAETSNPRNRLGVECVEVKHPSSLLTQGLVLIDTPGVGSTFRHNTEATLNFLPQCDAALFVVSADPPITETEVAFLKQVVARVPRLVYVLNKADLLTEEELHAATEFMRKTLLESVNPATPPVIFPVSSREGLRARAENDRERWARSGLAAVEQHLLKFLATEKKAALDCAIARKADAVLDEVSLKVRLMIQSFEMPLADLEQRLARFDRRIAEAERQRIITTDLLAGARNRLVNVLEEQSEALRRKYRKALRETVEQACQNNHDLDEKTARDALAEKIPIFFERELGEMSRAFNERVADAIKPHEKAASDLIEDVRRTAAELFEIPYHAPRRESAYLVVKEPYWVTHKWSSSLSPLPEGFGTRLLPRAWRQRILRKKLDAQIEELVISNVENLRWATLQNLDASFRRLTAELDERLRMTIEATRGAIHAAIEKRRKHAESIAEDVRALQTLMQKLDGLIAQLATFCNAPSATQNPSGGRTS